MDVDGAGKAMFIHGLFLAHVRLSESCVISEGTGVGRCRLIMQIAVGTVGRLFTVNTLR